MSTITRHLIIGLVAFAPVATAAQSNRSTQDTGDGGRAAHASAPRGLASRASGAIRLDGKLDEAAWSGAEAITTFTQLDPDEGLPVTEPTEVRILYDNDALYIGAYLKDSGPVRTRLGRRDAFLTDSDFFIVLLDSYHDHLTAYRFAINPSGVKRDEIVVGGEQRGGGGGGGGAGGDTSWDPVWDAATAIAKDGWIAELRIPFSQLRFSPSAEQTWGMQLERRIIRKQEHAVFSFTRKTERAGVARFGHLEGIRAARTGKRLELLPYAAARSEHREVARNAAVAFANPFRTADDRSAAAGLDVKYRVTSNFTLNGTVNPDFGQVEVDPAVVNLTAFETRFDEKRPFFVEGADIFRFGAADGGGFGGGPGGGGGRGGFGGGGGDPGSGPPQLLYARRIGRAPQGSAPGSAVYADAPDATTILGAAKVTGRTPNGWSIGLLDAVTAEERARYVGAAGVHDRAVVEPASNYFAARLRRDLRAGQTSFGGMFTTVHRKVEGELANRLRDQAYTGGIDFSIDWAQRVWSLDGYASTSLIRGEPLAIVAAQRSSARYYQRPDAGHIEVDSSATSMQGYAARLELGKRAGLWQGGASLTAIDPGYEINDLGFQSAADRISLDANIRYEQTQPRAFYRRWSLRLAPEADWNFAGDRLKAGLGLNLNGQLANYWSGGAGVTRQLQVLDDRLTRGGPLALKPATTSVNANIFSDFRKPYAITLFGNYSWDAADASRASLNFSVNLRPKESWDVRLAPNISRSRTPAQYVTAVSDASATATFGRRYVFAELEQTTVSLETRLNFTFNPELTLEVFAQPFISSGDYEHFKQLVAPRSFSFARYGRDMGTTTRNSSGGHVIDPDGSGPAAPFTIADRDFNFASLRGNAVLRWEWRPGSTLFLVWQQNRAREVLLSNADADDAPPGGFDLFRDTRELFGVKPANVFLLKLTYWINP